MLSGNIWLWIGFNLFVLAMLAVAIGASIVRARHLTAMSAEPERQMRDVTVKEEIVLKK